MINKYKINKTSMVIKRLLTILLLLTVVTSVSAYDEFTKDEACVKGNEDGTYNVFFFNVPKKNKNVDQLMFTYLDNENKKHWQKTTFKNPHIKRLKGNKSTVIWKNVSYYGVRMIYRNKTIIRNNRDTRFNIKCEEPKENPVKKKSKSSKKLDIKHDINDDREYLRIYTKKYDSVNYVNNELIFTYNNKNYTGNLHKDSVFKGIKYDIDQTREWLSIKFDKKTKELTFSNHNTVDEIKLLIKNNWYTFNTSRVYYFNFDLE